MELLDSKKNPDFEYCEAKYWLAYKDNQLVGRIAGIYNKNISKSGRINMPASAGLILLMMKKCPELSLTRLRFGQSQKEWRVSTVLWDLRLLIIRPY